MATNKQVKTKRDLSVERLKGKYPDKEFEDDESIFGQINDDYDDYDKQISERDQQIETYKGHEKAMSDLFGSDSRSAAMMQAWRNGQDPIVFMVENFGDDIREALDDPDKMEELKAARQSYLDKVSEETKLGEEYDKNLKESFKIFDAFMQKHGMTEEQFNELMDKVTAVIREGIMGKFSEETLESFMKASNYDNDVEAAGAEGEIRGKNGKIEAKLRERGKSDGIPDLSGKNGGGGGRPMPDMGALGNYGTGNTTIYERGGEKRRPAKR